MCIIIPAKFNNRSIMRAFATLQLPRAYASLGRYPVTRSVHCNFLLRHLSQASQQLERNVNMLHYTGLLLASMATICVTLTNFDCESMQPNTDLTQFSSENFRFTITNEDGLPTSKFNDQTGLTGLCYDLFLILI